MNEQLVPGIYLHQFYNKKTLNIFCDASIVKTKKSFMGCYGVVAVVEDTILDSIYRLVSDTTNNESEIKGLRAAIGMAYQYNGCFRTINIFSDSKISIMGLTKYIYHWRYNKHDGLLYGTSRNPISNQEIFIECVQLLKGLSQGPSIICLYHQAGHVSNHYENLRHAAEVFATSNNILGSVDMNLIRYLSTYNNLVDHNSREFLHKASRTGVYIDPVSFFAQGKINKK